MQFFHQSQWENQQKSADEGADLATEVRLFYHVSIDTDLGFFALKHLFLRDIIDRCFTKTASP